MCLQLGGLSCSDYKKILMKTGLVLLVLGHIGFITAALLHGTALRYVTDTHDAVSLQYAVSNILAVTSAILIIACGITVIVLSRYLSLTSLGRSLLATCSFGNSELLSLTPDCPFDPTRIYSSTLCLWAISLALCVAESAFAVRAAQLTHQLLELRPWWGKRSQHLITESSNLSEGRDLLSCSSLEPVPV
ncbi:transmembrane protein 54 isoform X3 [Trichosurus vulpecula]|uniref:transmembrane protein 54 isoform X3 n=1 Tax=Trichosurus vulpecula TaxID=9337 RepID=UPI00186AD5EB|nr:transmembrane protein 54 isoform X3 [Trichosurus vulpecula]